MKLRNKKTGEIKDLLWVINNLENDKDTFTLAELNEDWEDYEEPKEYWRIDCDGTLSHGRDEFNTPFDNACKSLGNYFETEEEAEKAVEKLKAWKRLKDKGFRFVRIKEQNEGHRVGQYIEFEMAYHFTPDAWQIGDDLDLLFSQEDD